MKNDIGPNEIKLGLALLKSAIVMPQKPIAVPLYDGSTPSAFSRQEMEGIEHPEADGQPTVRP